jgi:hypothetical protein
MNDFDAPNVAFLRIRYGIIARFTTSMVRRSGMLLTTCQNNSNVCTMRGYSSFARDTFVGLTRRHGLGRILVVSAKENAKLLTVVWSCVITVMHLTASSVLLLPSRSCQRVLGTVLIVSLN